MFRWSIFFYPFKFYVLFQINLEIHMQLVFNIDSDHFSPLIGALNTFQFNLILLPKFKSATLLCTTFH